MKYLLALVWIPVVAYAAEGASRALTIDSRFWWVHFFVTLLCLAGWAGSSLPKLAGWKDGPKAQLEILQGIVVAGLAGSIAYYGGFYLLAGTTYALPEVGCFMATIVAAWGGDKFLTPLLNTLGNFVERITGKAVP